MRFSAYCVMKTMTSRYSASADPTLSSKSARVCWERLWPVALAAILVAGSIAARIVFRDVVTSDLDFYVLRWYRKFQDLGIRVGLGKDFYNYSPPYMYLLAISTLASKVLPAVTAVKLISTGFDAAAAYWIFRIVRLSYPQGHLPVLAAAIFFSAPTVVANTAIWGQADSTYTAFLLACLYFLLIDRPLPAILAFSIGFAFKPQAIFLSPLLILMALWKRMPWYFAWVVPAVYAMASLPAVVFGRTWLEVLTIYLSRPSSGKALTHNAPSLYVFVPREALGFLAGPGVLIGLLVILAWILLTFLFAARHKRPPIVLLALIAVTLTPFVLPNMHDRYFYPADALSIVLAFTLPEVWFVAALFQIISGLSYSIYLMSASPGNLEIAALLNAAVLLVLLARQLRPALSPEAGRLSSMPPDPPAGVA
jgi:Gpi18-like mannosyltransferase